jgi:hypothetical protein
MKKATRSLIPVSCWHTLRSPKWRRYIPRKHCLTFVGLHAVASEKTAVHFIITAVRTSNPATNFDRFSWRLAQMSWQLWPRPAQPWDASTTKSNYVHLVKTFSLGAGERKTRFDYAAGSVYWGFDLLRASFYIPTDDKRRCHKDFCFLGYGTGNALKPPGRIIKFPAGFRRCYWKFCLSLIISWEWSIFM